MSRLLGIRLLAVTLTSAVALCVPGAAHAERVVTQDPAGDVFYQDFSGGQEGGSAPVLAPNNAGIDITRTIVNHRAERLRLSMRFRDLSSRGQLYSVFRVATPKRNYMLFVYRLRGPRATVQASLENEINGREVKCQGLRASLAPRTDTLAASVPRKCLSSPRWVKIGAGASTMRSMPDRAGVRVHSDDGHHAGVPSGDMESAELALGPKVRRG